MVLICLFFRLFGKIDQKNTAKRNKACFAGVRVYIFCRQTCLLSLFLFFVSFFLEFAPFRFTLAFIFASILICISSFSFNQTKKTKRNKTKVVCKTRPLAPRFILVFFFQKFLFLVYFCVKNGSNIPTVPKTLLIYFLHVFQLKKKQRTNKNM